MGVVCTYAITQKIIGKIKEFKEFGTMINVYKFRHAIILKKLQIEQPSTILQLKQFGWIVIVEIRVKWKIDINFPTFW